MMDVDQVDIMLAPGDLDLDESHKDAIFTEENNPNLDGDYVALDKRRQIWLKERAERRDSYQLGNKPFDPKQLLRGLLKSEAYQNLLKQTTSALTGKLLTAARNNDLETIRPLVGEILQSGKGLGHKDNCDPESSANAFHVAIQYDAQNVAEFLIDQGGQGLIEVEYDVAVYGVTSKRTALHLLAARGDVAMAKKVLNHFSSASAKKEFMEKFTMVKPQGQRPRPLSAIHIAAWKGNNGFVELLIEEGISVNFLNNKKDTPFIWAVRGGFLDLVNMMINRGADVNQANDKGSIAIHWAVRYGHKEVLKALVEKGKAKVNQSRKQGLEHPLLLAAALGELDMVDLLLKHGADISIKTSSGETSLHQASKEGHTDIVEFLLGKNVDINGRTELGNTPLMLALRNNHPETVASLVVKGADISLVNQEGHSIWDMAIMASGSEAVLSLVQSLETNNSKFLSRSGGVLPRLMFTPPACPLHVCAAVGDVAKLKDLLALNLDLSCTDENGNTLMHVAALNNKPAILEVCVGQTDINAQNKDGNSALHLACMMTSEGCVDVLIRNNAKLDVKNKMGRTPLHVTAHTENTTSSIMKKLVNTGIKTHHWNFLDNKDSYGNTALHLAAINGCSAEVIKELADLNVRLQNLEGNNPLHLAILNKQEATFMALMEIFEKRGRDLDLDQKNKDGKTLLHLATAWADVDVFKSLINAGSDVSLGDDEGNTMLHQLVIQSVQFNERRLDYIRLFQMLAQESHRWWCIRKHMSMPEDPEQRENCMRSAMLVLTSRLQNKAGFTVLSLASKIGATELLTRILHLSNVYRIDKGQTIEYDITFLAPSTMPPPPVVTNDKGRPRSISQVEILDKRKNQRSCLENIVHLPSTTAATHLLNLPVFSLLEKSYQRTTFWAYLFPFLIHVLHMGLFSYYSLPIYVKALDNSTSSPPVFPAVMFLIWPALTLIYELYYLSRKILSALRTKNEDQTALQLSTRGHSISIHMRLIESIFSHVTILAFILSALAWFIAYMYQFYNQEYFLAIALIIGWLAAITLTRGFKAVHHFSRMLQYICVRDITRFVFVYICVLLGFSFAFHALFQSVHDLKTRYPNPLYTMFFVFNLMIGMGDIFDEDFDKNFQDAGEGIVFARVVYVAYVTLATIILLNLLIAMMNESYQAIQRRHETSWRIAAINLGLIVEKIAPWMTSVFTGPTIETRLVTVGTSKETRYYMSAKKGEVIGLEEEHKAEENTVMIRELRRRVDIMDERLKQVLETLQQLVEIKTHDENQTSYG